MERSGLRIRADATTEIGAGHVMRSLALAQEWISHGGRATFLRNVDRAGDLIDILRARTFPPYRGAYFRTDEGKVFLRPQLLKETNL